MLVLGYRGTLQPDTPFPPGETPPQMAALLTPLLEQALAELDIRLPATQRIFQGQPIPVDGLLATLRERLEEILTLPLAEHLAATNAGSVSENPPLYREYPALTPLLHQAIVDWATATVTFCRRLKRDSDRIAQSLALDSFPPIASITATTSDMHSGGHLVLRILFRNGSCIFYKPRPITGEWLWHALLQSITTADPELPLPAARAMPGACPDRYGWMESVLTHPSTPCRQSTPAYWHTAGAMLCLARIVGLTDLHMGNIIATTTGPAVTDAECLGTPIQSDSAIRKEKSHDSTFNSTLQSLLNTGLLPDKTPGALPDISGLFGSAASVSALHLPQWTSNTKAKQFLCSTPAMLLDHGNSPGAPSPLTVLHHLVNGYRHAAEVLLHARSTILAPESSWRQLLIYHHAPRVVLRDTLTYALLLSQSLAPIHLRSTQQRQFEIRDLLQQIKSPHLPASVLRAEHRSLLHLHIPRLVLLAGSRTLANASGAPIVHQFVTCPPAAEVIARINNLSQGEIETTHIPALISALLSPPKHA